MDVVPFTDDANRQQSVSRFFYLLGDVSAGMDGSPRLNGDGGTGPLMGPNQATVDIGMGAGGEIFKRGSAGQIGTATSTTANGANTAATMQNPLAMLTRNPLLLLLLAGGAYLLLRKR